MNRKTILMGTDTISGIAPEIIESMLPMNRIEIKFDEDEDYKLFMEIKILGNEEMKGYFNLNE